MLIVHPKQYAALQEFMSRPGSPLTDADRERMRLQDEHIRRDCYLLPTTKEEWGLLESADVGDVGLHERCKECQQSDFTAYHILHKPDCKTAERLRQSIAALSDEQRKELYRGTEYL